MKIKLKLTIICQPELISDKSLRGLYNSIRGIHFPESKEEIDLSLEIDFHLMNFLQPNSQQI